MVQSRLPDAIGNGLAVTPTINAPAASKKRVEELGRHMVNVWLGGREEHDRKAAVQRHLVFF